MSEPSAEPWLVTETGFDPARANAWETLFTVGNGFLGTRGSLEEGHRGERSGTFVAGVYDHHDAAVTDLVNAPDWLSVAVEVGGVRLDVQTCEVAEHRRELDLRQGVLRRRTVFVDGEGRRTRLETLRFASMAERDLCALRVEVTAENHTSPVTVVSAIDGRRRNLDRMPAYADGTAFHPEVAWEKWAWSRHLEETGRGADADGIHLEMRTIDSGVDLAYAAAVVADEHEPSSEQRYEWVGQRVTGTLDEGRTLRIDKLVSVATGRLEPDPLGRARAALARHREAGFDAALAQQVAAWETLWHACDCEIVGDADAAKAVRFGIYHLLITANPEDPTVNIGAKSLSGEGYRGHVFWDTEILMLPFFIFTQPDTARALLQYRYHTLPAARDIAREWGQRGARYPWESADTGREECPIWTNDGKFRFWSRDEEIHVSSDVAYGILSYVAASEDQTFLLDVGAEILFETSRFWVDRAAADTPDPTKGYSINRVMGPDEFHSHVDDNAFTNELARWSLRKSADVYDQLAGSDPDRLAAISAAIGLTPDEVEHWRAVADQLVAPVVHDGVIEQFAGYFDRLDVAVTEWDENNMPRYPEGYHHFNCEDTMLLKQPDVIMLMHVLPDEFDLETKRANFAFYEARTLHKSSLSPAIHAIMGLDVGDASRALQYFARSAFVDLTDNQGNTAEGMHIASAGGTWQTVIFGFAGFRVLHDTLTFDPRLPEGWERIRFRLHWRGASVAVDLGHDDATLTLEDEPGRSLDVVVAGRTVRLEAGSPQVLKLKV